MPLERNTLLKDRYRIVEILGEGGMGAVYCAEDESLGVTVAVKENLFSTDEYARQFRIEATILASLRHPNLTRVTDHFEERDSQYLVMDFIEGEDLRDRMDRLGILDEDEVITIGMAICEALHYLHTRVPTVLHRDVKPGNVKIAPNGQVYLVDFGLAKIVHGTQMTITGARAMTPGYSPPEQYGTARTDARSDVYSLGATLYSALTSALPEDGLARAMNQVELTPIRKQNPKISRKLAATLGKALEVQPDDRYQTAEEFRKALKNSRGITRRRQEDLIVEPPPAADENAAAQIGIQPNNLTMPPPGEEAEPRVVSPASQPVIPPPQQPDQPLFLEERSPAPKKKKKRRRSGCLLSLLLILAILIGGGAAAYYFLPDWTNQALAYVFAPSPTQTPRPTATETAVVLEPTPTMSPAPSLTPEPATETTEMADTVQPTSTLTPTSIPPTTRVPTATEVLPPTRTPRPTRTPTITPTPVGGSGEIAFASDASGDPQVWIMNIDGTGLRQLTNLAQGACQPDWSPDGERLVFISPCLGEQEEYPGSRMYVINADGSALMPLAFSESGDYDPAWSPDGNKIAFTSLRNGFAQIFVLDLADGSATLLASEGIKNIQPAWLGESGKIAFVSLREGPYQIWTMNEDGSNQTRFSRSGDLKNSLPGWSPDGMWLVFTQRELPVGAPGIIGAPVDDGGFSEVRLSNVLTPSRNARFSPDGTLLIFESWPDGTNHDIYIMDFETNELTRVTSDPAFDFDPAWRP